MSLACIIHNNVTKYDDEQSRFSRFNGNDATVSGVTMIVSREMGVEFLFLMLQYLI